jgi:hypothetical protein
MKITRRQVRRLIREALELNEQWIADLPVGADVLVKHKGDWRYGHLVDTRRNEYEIEWDDTGKFMWVPKEDVKMKPEEGEEDRGTGQEIGDLDSAVVEIAWKVLAGSGRDKDYRPTKVGLFVDSENDTAVGVLHFTTRGMLKLYDAMNRAGVIGKYFPGKTYQDLIAYSGGPSGWHGNEGQKNGAITSSGYQEGREADWWAAGMRAFLESSDSIPVQNDAVLRKFADRVPGWKAKGYPFKTMRDLAIFMSLGNSRWSHVRDFGRKTGWDPDKMMKGYCDLKSRSRCKHTDRHYPRDPKQG